MEPPPDRPRVPVMAIFHRATITPGKADLIAEWAPTRPWGPSAADPVDVIGSYRFDDPDSRVGMETHLVTAGGALLQVPLTYRDEPLDGAEDALITEMQHSVLGTRWVYDGLRDPQFVIMLAAVAMTGQGEALGLAVYAGRWYIAPSNVRIQGGGWTEGECRSMATSNRQRRRFDLTTTGSALLFRRPVPGPRPQRNPRWDGGATPARSSRDRERWDARFRTFRILSSRSGRSAPVSRPVAGSSSRGASVDIKNLGLLAAEAVGGRSTCCRARTYRMLLSLLHAFARRSADRLSVFRRTFVVGVVCLVVLLVATAAGSVTLVTTLNNGGDLTVDCKGTSLIQTRVSATRRQLRCTGSTTTTPPTPHHLSGRRAGRLRTGGTRRPGFG
jgi:hypothetical protein